MILINGWLRAYDYRYLWMHHLSHYLQQLYGDEVVVVGNHWPVNDGDISKYVGYLGDLVGGDPDEDTYFIGESWWSKVMMVLLL